MASPKILSRDECAIIVRECFNSEAFEILKYEERTLSENPMGLLGDHFKVAISVLHEGITDHLSFFAKTLPVNENQVKLIEETGAFRKEVMFYSILVEELRGIKALAGTLSKSLGSSKQSKEENTKTWLCKCYLVRPDVIVLEDLVQSGFVGFSPRDVFDFRHTKLILEKLALFHASSLILEEKQTQKTGKPYRINEVYPELLDETFYQIKPNHPGQELIDASVDAMLSLSKLLPLCKSADVEQLIDQKLPEVLQSILDLVKPSDIHRNVICHSDMWSNNILCRYGDDGCPLDARLIDYQLIRYVPPAQDIFNFLYLMTRRKFREEYLGKFLSIYYQTLSNELQHHHLNPETILPWSELLETCQEQRRCGRINAVHCLHFVTLDRAVLREVMKDSDRYQDVVTHGRKELVCSQFKEDSEYRERMAEVLSELIECHVLPKEVWSEIVSKTA